MFTETKKFCDALVAGGVPGLDIAVCQKGKPIFRYQSGYRDLENKIKMDGKERYNIYSCSKPITCVAAMQLWEKGMFSLEDDLAKYMPEFSQMTVKTEGGIRPAKKQIKIRHLFEMTAGFAYDLVSDQLLACREETAGRCQTREVMKYLAKEPLDFEPGDHWSYSLCHDVLAALVEVLSGESFQDYVKTHIFQVAGMQDSTFMLPPEELETVAPQYRFADGKVENIGKEIFQFKIGSQYASGGAGCISTVDDYMKFAEALRLGRLIKPQTLALMITPRLTPEQIETFWQKDNHTYGLGMRCPKGDPRYEDFGWGGAAGAFLAIDLKRELSLYMGMHILSSPVGALRPYVYRFIRAELENPAAVADIYAELKDKKLMSVLY